MKQLLKAGFLFSVFLLFGACGGSKNPRAVAMYGMSESAAYTDIQYDRAEALAATPATGAGSASQLAENSSSRPMEESGAIQSRKLVKNADLRVRVEDPEAAEKILTGLMEKYGAWSASTGIYENSRNYSIRVPLLSYEKMLTDLAGLGKTLWRTENAEDVTLRYYDLESRLITKKELLKTYQGYLSKAANIDEIMTVESRIADLQREIEQTGIQFRNLSNLVDYSTINLEIAGPVSSYSYSEPTLRERLSELFGSVGSVASSALVILTGIIIYGIPAILILTLLFWILFGRIGLLKKLWRLVAGKK